MKKGERIATGVTIIKVKNERATVIETLGNRYVLDLKTPKARGKK